MGYKGSGNAPAMNTSRTTLRCTNVMTSKIQVPRSFKWLKCSKLSSNSVPLTSYVTSLLLFVHSSPIFRSPASSGLYLLRLGSLKHSLDHGIANLVCLGEPWLKELLRLEEPLSPRVKVPQANTLGPAARSEGEL